MSDIRVKFLGSEYSVPEDVLFYIDLLNFTENIQKQLASAFVRKLKNELDKGNVGCLDDKLMAPDIEQQVGEFIAKLTEHGIYDRTINDYLRKNEGFKLISQVNAAALEEAKRVFKQQVSDWLEGYEDALHKKDASVTGLGFSIWSGSFVNHAIYAAMEVSKVNEQEKAAVKEYQKDMAELRARLDNRKAEEENRYISNTYIPHMEAAITVFSYELLDTFISDLIQYGKLSKDVLNYIHIDRSNDLLKNLELSQNKEAVLLKAFEACPYNIAVYMQAMKYDLLDYESFQTAKVFKHGDTIISFLEENLGVFPNLEKKRLNFKNAELLSLYSGRSLREITSYVADFIVNGYTQTIAALTNSTPCYNIMNKVDERDILAGDSISKQKSAWLVDPLVPTVLWDKLTSEYGHTDLFDKLLSLLPDRPEINSKKEYDEFLKERLFAIFETVRQERVAAIHAQRQEEARRKEEEAEKAKRTAKRSKIITILCLIMVIIAIIIAIASSIINKANNAKAYQDMAGEFCVYRAINDDGEERNEFNWWLSVDEDGTIKMSSWSYAFDNTAVTSYSGALKNKVDFRKFEDYRIEDYCADASDYEKATYCYEFHIADEWYEFDGYIVCWQYQNGKIVDVYCDDYRYSFVEIGNNYTFDKWADEIDSDGLSESVKEILDNIANDPDSDSKSETEGSSNDYSADKEKIEYASKILGRRCDESGKISLNEDLGNFINGDNPLFDEDGHFELGAYSEESKGLIIDTLDWVSSGKVKDFSKIISGLQTLYGTPFYVNDIGDEYAWIGVGIYEDILCVQNEDGTVTVRWVYDASEKSNTSNKEYDEYLTWYNVDLASSFLGKELNADGSISMDPGDYEAMSNDMYLFNFPGRFSHGMSSADTEPVIVDILDWITTESIEDFNIILNPLIERYGDDYHMQHYDDAAGDAYMWKDVEIYEYVICWQNADGTVDIRWTVSN